MKKILFVVVVLVLLSFSGCSQAGGEYSKLMVQVLALDKSKGGEYELSLLAYTANSTAGMLGEGGAAGTLELVSAKGKSVQSALSNVSLTTGLSPFYDHNNGIILGEEVTKEDIGKILNSFLQYTKMRPSVDVFVCKGEAKELVEKPEEGKTDMARQVYLLAQSGEENGKIAKASMKEILSREIGAYQDAYIPMIAKQKIIDGEEISANGTAIFKNGVLMGYLDEIETRGMMFVLNKMKRGVAVIDQKEIGKATYEFTNCSTDVSARVESGRPTYDINVQLRANLFESGSDLDIRYGSHDMALAKTAVEEYVRDCIMQSVDKALKTYESDVFLFGQRLHLKDRQFLASMDDRWQKKIMEAKFNVRVNVDVRHAETDVAIRGR